MSAPLAALALLSTQLGNAVETQLALREKYAAWYHESSRSTEAPPWPRGFHPDEVPVYARNEVRIAASPEQVLKILLRAPEWPTFYPNAAFVEIQGDPLRGTKHELTLGDRFKWTTFGTRQESEVKEFTALPGGGYQLGWSAQGGNTDTFHRWFVYPTVSGSRVVTEESERGLGASATRLIQNKALHAAHQLWVERLKTRVEGSLATAKNDSTAEFFAAKSVEAARLRPYRILFIPGLVTDRTEQVGELLGRLGLTAPQGFLASFFQQSRWISKEAPEVDFVMAPINRAGSLDDNGDKIAAAIKASPKKVLVVSQSKGGVDFLHGLVRHPEIRSKVAGWVAYQPPIAGSTLADLLEKNQVQGFGNELLLKTIGGTNRSIEDMTTWKCTVWNAQHSSELGAVPGFFPVVSLVTHLPPVSSAELRRGPLTRFHFLSAFVEPITKNGGGDNDGIASVEGTCLPGSACINHFGEELDHFETVMDTSPFVSISEAQRIELFRKMVTLVLDRVERR